MALLGRIVPRLGRGAIVVAMLATAAVFGPVRSAGAAQETFCSNNAMPIPATGTQGRADPYPSVVNVNGLGPSTTRVSVQLNDLSHTFPHDLDVLLVGPTGASFIVMSDTGGSNDVNLVDLTIRDSFFLFPQPQLPETTQISSGTYRPANYGAGDVFPSPAPGGTPASPAPVGTATFASAFGGTNPNGNWRLFVHDDAGGDTGTLGGWCITVATGDQAPEFVDSPCGSSLLVPALGGATEVEFSAIDPDAGEQVSLSAAGVPDYASFDATSGNPASASLSVDPNIVDFIMSVVSGSEPSVVVTATSGSASATCAVALDLTLASI